MSNTSSLLVLSLLTLWELIEIRGMEIGGLRAFGEMLLEFDLAIEGLRSFEEMFLEGHLQREFEFDLSMKGLRAFGEMSLKGCL